MNKKATIPSLQIRQMFSASQASLIIGVLLAAILAYLQSEVVEKSVVIFWFSIIAVISLVRFIFLLSYQHSSIDSDTATRVRLTHFRIGVIASGVVWGIAGFLLFPSNDYQHQIFLIFILAGLTAGGVVSFSADIFSSVGYAFTVLTPIIIRLFIAGDTLSEAMGLSGLLYLGFIIFTSLYIHRSLSENFLLRIEAVARERILRDKTIELELHNRTLAQINQHTALPVFLDHLVKQVETLHPDMICSILLVDSDRKTLCHGAAPSLPHFFNQAVNGMLIGNDLISKPAVPFHSKRVIVDDVQQHPYWAEYRDLARLAVIHSCWSQPFKNKEGKMLGTFVIYHRQPMLSTEHNLTLLERYANLAQTVIESYRSQNELRIAATAFETHESLMITDANRLIIRVNQAFIDETGYSFDEVADQTPSVLSSGRHDDAFYKEMWDCIERTGAWQGEIWDRRKNGEVYPKWLTITAVKGEDKVVTHYVGSHTDITERKAAEDKIKHLAFYDPLTNLPNRRLLMDRLQQSLASISRNNHSGALLFIDMDNFKILNDTLGHDIGDILLQQVAQRLISCVREGDTVARLGGDEFVVMLDGLSDQSIEAAEQTKLISNKIFSSLTQPYQLSTHEYHCTPSIGVTLFEDHNAAVEDLLKQADIAMYQAKKSGRNTLCFFDAKMQEVINSRAQLEEELHNALVNNQFQLFYQVQVDSDLKPLGAEALIRWMHPLRGMISPAEFIPLAEEIGLILPIGQWVLETACAKLKEWEKYSSTSKLVLAVNVSAKQFNQIDFAVQVQEIVQRYRINPTLLKLELTESMLVENIEGIILCMNTLKRIGLKFSLDDFGTGYSSLQYLQRLPLDQLKIDQSFVRNISPSLNSNAIVRTIIALANSLNLDIIAEGVETEEQQQLLQFLGCPNFQGYLFSKPVPIEKFEDLVIGVDYY